jgi:hypothetical protein
VYALAATLYKMITGVTPPDALERRVKYEKQNKELILEPHKIDKKISINRENAILNAMNVDAFSFGTETLDIDPTGEHKFTVFVEITYKDGYSKDGEKVYKCEVCVAEEKTTMPALILIDGYSIKNDGTAITCDFDIKVEVLNQYESITGKKVEFGIFVTGAKMLAGAGGLLDENGALTSEKFTMSGMDEKYETMSVTVSSMPSDLSLVDAEFVMGMFVTIDGETTLEQSDAYVSQILDGAFNTISVRKIAELTNEDGIFDNIIALPKKDEE